MRREWGPWIKTRQWHEFERLAKIDPSQPLADTIAELERGFPEKVDRRALRKVLFFLRQAGYVPQPLDESDNVPDNVPSVPPAAEIGYMVGASLTVFALAKRIGARWRMLVVEQQPGRGIKDAFEAEVEASDSAGIMAKLAHGAPGPRPVAEAPIDFVRARIAEELRATKGPLPSVVAFWRSDFQNLPPYSHPAESLPRVESILSPWELSDRFDLGCVWRLELGAAAKCILDYREAYGEPDGFMEFARHAVPILFTPEVAESRTRMLLDLGYLLYLANRPGSGEVLGVADDVRERGASSPYAEHTVVLTLHALESTYRSETTASRTRD